MTRSAEEVVIAFNQAINDADLERLEGLMSDAHRFVDAGGSTVVGKQHCVAAWASFFRSFPDYRNVFESITVETPGRVVISGRSTCSYEPLAGPAKWYASVAGGLVTEWRVEDAEEPG